MKEDLTGHEVITVREMGWESRENGELLALADASFDVFVTNDRNLRYQQNLARLHRLAVVVLLLPNNRQQTIRSLSSQVLSVISMAQPGAVDEIRHPGYRRAL